MPPENVVIPFDKIITKKLPLICAQQNEIIVENAIYSTRIQRIVPKEKAIGFNFIDLVSEKDKLKTEQYFEQSLTNKEIVIFDFNMTWQNTYRGVRRCRCIPIDKGKCKTYINIVSNE